MKVKIEGTEYDFDSTRLAVAEAIALEKVMGMTIGEWNDALNKESAFATAGMVWLVLRRSGSDVRFKDIEDGTYPVDLAAIEFNSDDEAAEADPTAEADDAPDAAA
jgi:hypothetical protein